MQILFRPFLSSAREHLFFFEGSNNVDTEEKESSSAEETDGMWRTFDTLSARECFSEPERAPAPATLAEY